ncbi:hypothetical protein GCM10007881_27110 [Mesorhizobium huakuii]|uniref:terminase small subunit n=1 Tax=Mesorhizobium huakuii TaxID=28104 RepID=UPI0019255C4D|nr:hypothetical protein MesoLj131c_63920 [Mesorhizobium sp. 131-3-5]GLQ79193.1 hypothetical protein GCM10007881_27110 [Mesorhizobium huakuii]
MADLTPQQDAFCLAYIETGNASQAYRTAFDVGENTMPATLWSEASRLTRLDRTGAKCPQPS